jgi:hypothetical protein
MKKHSFNLTYVEGFLLLTNGVSASALHRQHNVLADQSSVIAKLSCDLGRLNQELLELKTVKSVSNADLASTKIIETNPSFFSDFTGISSYLDPKILAGIALTGAVYYGTPYLLSKIALPSLKSILIPVKSAAIACLPFMKEVQLIESIKDGCTYRVVLTGNKLSEIEVRRIDSPDFEPVSDLLTQHFLQQDNTQSVSVNSLVSSNNAVCDNTESSIDSAVNTSQSVIETLDKTPTAEATNTLIDVLSTLS